MSDTRKGRPPVTRDETLEVIRQLGVVTPKGLADIMGVDARVMSQRLRRYADKGLLKSPEGAPGAWMPVHDEKGHAAVLTLAVIE